MKSTGEAMGTGDSFAEAFAKSIIATNGYLPKNGTAFISTKDNDKPAVVALARDLSALGFTLIATKGTAKTLQQAGVKCGIINKVREGRPHIVDMIKNDDIHFIINTTDSKPSLSDSYMIRRSAVQNNINYYTTIAGAQATILAMRHQDEMGVRKL